VAGDIETAHKPSARWSQTILQLDPTYRAESIKVKAFRPRSDGLSIMSRLQRAILT
jgi:hypothetical protein